MPLAEQIKLSLVECLYLQDTVWEDYQLGCLTGLLAAENLKLSFPMEEASYLKSQNFY